MCSFSSNYASCACVYLFMAFTNLPLIIMISAIRYYYNCDALEISQQIDTRHYQNIHLRYLRDAADISYFEAVHITRCIVIVIIGTGHLFWRGGNLGAEIYVSGLWLGTGVVWNVLGSGIFAVFRAPENVVHGEFLVLIW